MSPAYFVILGFTFGVLAGYILRNVQDAKYIQRLRDIENEFVNQLKTDFKRREENYKAEINRLHESIARSAAERIQMAPEKATLTDFYEYSLSQDNYKEINFKDGGDK